MPSRHSLTALIFGFALTFALSGCENARVRSQDAGTDASTDTGMSAVDEGTGPVACTDIGTYSCNGGGGVECCSDGFEHEFVDGPCWTYRSDGGGVADCSSSPDSAGCPCTTEEESRCRAYQPSLICREGYWRTWTGHVCC